MARNLLIFFIGALIIPGAILGGAIALQSGKTPSDCGGRSNWVRDSNTRFAAAEGVAGGTNRLQAGDSALQAVATSYAAAGKAQLDSHPPASDAASNALIAQYFQMMGENWAGWVANPYLAAHAVDVVQTVTEGTHKALLASQEHCG